MEYSIKDLNSHWISKTLVYEVLKNSLPISEKFIKNKRLFNEHDLEIFNFYKNFWQLETVSKYWTSEKTRNTNTLNKTVWNSFETDNKQFENSPNSLQIEIKKALNLELETVKKQFENEKTVLQQELKKKDEIIEIKENQAQKYALMKVEEEKEKKEWIEKYEAEIKQKGEWIKKFYWLKTYLIVFIILFCVSLFVLVLIFTKVISI